MLEIDEWCYYIWNIEIALIRGTLQHKSPMLMHPDPTPNSMSNGCLKILERQNRIRAIDLSASADRYFPRYIALTALESYLHLSAN